MITDFSHNNTNFGFNDMDLTQHESMFRQENYGMKDYNERLWQYVMSYS